MIEHQELTKILNRRAENARMNELEKHSTPLFWALLIFTAMFTAWVIV